MVTTKRMIPTNLRLLIGNRGLKLIELHEETGIPIGTLSEIQNGIRFADLHQLEKLCKALHVTPQEIYPNDELRKIIFGE